MKPRHQADLVWRFQHANEVARSVPSALAVLANICQRGSVVTGGEPGVSISDAHLSAVERMERIDAILERLPTKPVSLNRVLCLRYGGTEEDLPELRLVLRENAAVAAMTPAAVKWFTRREGKPPRPRSHDLQHWLAMLCRRFSTHVANAVDTMVLDEIRRDTEALLTQAEDAYEAIADHRARAA